MSTIQVKDLIESGVHFGHRVSRWNPKMKPFIYGKRNLIHIINLKETIRGLVRGYNFLFKLSSEGGEVLFVGTKRQAQNVVFEEAQRCGMHFVTERWLGGTLTNFSTIRERLKRLADLKSLEETGEIEVYSKKAQSSLTRERKKIERNLSGIASMNRIPDALIIIDQRREKNAILEAHKLGIPVICILDTDCNPDLIDICIPGNDDAMRSIKVLLTKLTEAIVLGQKAYQESGAAQEKAKQEKAEEDARAERRSMAARAAAGGTRTHDNTRRDGARGGKGLRGAPEKGERGDREGLKEKSKAKGKGKFRPKVKGENRDKEEKGSSHSKEASSGNA